MIRDGGERRRDGVAPILAQMLRDTRDGALG
jgi:hypothetical protein